MNPTDLNLFFVQCMLQPEDPRGWKKFLARQYNQEYYLENCDKIKKCVKTYREKNLAQVTAYDYRRYHEDVGRRADAIARAAESAKRHPERNRINKRISAARPASHVTKAVYIRRRRAEDPEFKLLDGLRTRIRIAMQGNTKGAGTRELLGMEIKEFRIYLQGQFLPGMTWENYGPIWHIDHIRPCVSFDLTDPAQQRECFNWSNCQPLFAADNLRKGAHF